MRAFVILILLAVTLISCRKREKLTWDSDWIAPVVYGRLDLSNLIMDSILIENPDSSLILDFDQTVVELTLNDLVQIPDTTVSNKYTIPPPLTNLIVSAGQTFFNEPTDFKYDGLDVSLSKIDLKSGALQYNIISPIDRKTIVTYSIPGATKYGIPFEVSIEVPAAPTNGVSQVSGQINLTNYHFNLRGASNTLYNTLETNFVVELAPGEVGTTIYNTDTIILNTSFLGLEPSYAKGYFGQQSFKETESNLKNDLLDMYGGGFLDIERLKVSMFLENTIGVDGQIRINYLRGINEFNSSFIDLQHNVIGETVNINRAQDINGAGVSQPYEIWFNDLNSNIEAFFEILAQRLAYDVEIDLNPLGNVSNATDFAYCDGGISAGLHIEMPLSFYATDFILNDTLDIDFSNSGSLNLNFIELKLDVENHFPFSADISLYLLDSLGQVSDSINGNTISGGVMDVGNINVIAPSLNTDIYTLNSNQIELLKSSGRMIYSAKINTPPSQNHVKIKSNYYMDIKTVLKANTTLSL